MTMKSDSITVRDCVDKYGFFSVLPRDEISFIVAYLATIKLQSD